MTKWKLGLLGSNILLDKNLMDSWYLRLFDKLINWSFIFPKHFSSNPAHILKQWPSLRLAEAHEPSWHLAFFNAFEEMFPWGPRSITYEAEFKAMDFTVPEQSTGGACVFKVYFPGCLEHLWDHQSSKDQGPGQGSLLLVCKGVYKKQNLFNYTSKKKKKKQNLLVRYSFCLYFVCVELQISLFVSLLCVSSCRWVRGGFFN